LVQFYQLLNTQIIKKAVEFIKNAKIEAREKPLALYVFSSDSSVTDYVLKNTQSGGACINDTMLQYTCPGSFGGIGSSGIGGGIHGEDTFYNFVHKRTVFQNATYSDPSVRYPPYTPFKINAMAFFQNTHINFKKLFYFAIVILIAFLSYKYLDIHIKLKK